MASDVVNLQEVAQRKRDRAVIRKKLEGFPYWRIAEDLSCTVEEVKESLTRMCAGVTDDLKGRTTEINVERCEDLMQVFFPKAHEGDKEAAAICIRLMDREARFLGLDVLPAGDAARAVKREPSRYDKIREAVFRMARGPVIEGQAVEVRNE